ncbi:hypothetical protein TNCV_2502821 [Trichonephila clavipes]|nr:hypothetical protein TNCV_2502821 [Trichonephila clavipes]
MASSEEQAPVAAWFIEFKSATFVQRKCVTTILEFGREKSSLGDGWKERKSNNTFGLLVGIRGKIAYQYSINDTEEMKSRITVAIQIVDFEMLHRMRLEILYRLNVLLSTNSPHIEIGQ